MTALALRNLSVSFGTHTAVDDVSLDVAAGEIFGLVGESGSGKSMTALAIAGLAPPTARRTGRILLDGEDLADCDARRWRDVRGRKLGLVFQEPGSALNPLMTIGAQIAETLECHGVRRGAARDEVTRMLAEVGLSAEGVSPDRYPHELSGGQRQRVVIALAAIHRPSLLVADEPTTALDVTTQAQILDLLCALARDRGMGLLLISHDLAVIARYADRMAVLKEGRLVEQGPTARVLREPQHPYTVSLLGRAMPRRGKPPIGSDGPILRARGVSRVRVDPRKGFFTPPDIHPILTDVSIELHAGERVGLIGASGAGKSTLTRILLGLESFDAGEVVIEGTPLRPDAGARSKRRPNVVQAVFQDPAGSLNPRLRIARIVGEPLEHLSPRPDARERHDRIRDAVTQVGLDVGIVHRFPAELSGGQRQRVALARALVARPRALVLDEAVAALDAATRRQILELLDRLQNETGLAYLFVTHDLELARTLTDRLVVLKAGRVVETGPTERVLSEPQDPYTRALIDASPRWPATPVAASTRGQDSDEAAVYTGGMDR